MYYVFRAKISHPAANIFQGVYTEFLIKMSHPKAYIQPFLPKCPTPKKKKTISGQLTGNGFLQNGNSDQLSRESVLILQQRIILTRWSLPQNRQIHLACFYLNLITMNYFDNGVVTTDW
jgi:hypothetical protein